MAKKKNKKRKPRKWLAVMAWFRSSAGPMKNKKRDKKRIRRWKQRKDKDEY